jgi:hypothetical protein
MATNFPSSLDDSTTIPAESANTKLSTNHVTAHQNIQDAIEAIEAKVGANSSAVTTSHDYKLSEVTSTDKAVGKTATQTVSNKTFTSSTYNGVTLTTGGSATDVLNAQGNYINGAITDASTTVKGVVEEATLAETKAGTASGGTGARLFVNPTNIFDKWIALYGGDGADGAVTVNSGSFTSGPITSNTLTRDAFFTNLTIDATRTLNTGGYRLFVSGTLTVNGTLNRNGNNGTDGIAAANQTGDGISSGGAGGAAGAALSAGTIKGGLAGGAGQSGTNSLSASAGGSGSNETLGTVSYNGAAGGAGGAGSTTGGSPITPGSSGPAGATIQVSKFSSINLAISPYINGTAVGTSASSGGGGGGAQGNNNTSPASLAGGGGGGGAGSNGGLVVVVAKTISIGGTGVISANGGNGGAGGAGGTASGGSGSRNNSGGGGGGGGGGNGGAIVLIYNSLTNAGSITTTAGSAGAAGTGGSGASNGSAGTAGNAGTTYQFEI